MKRIVVLGLCGLIAVSAFAAPLPPRLPKPQPMPKDTVLPSGLRIEEVREGNGPAAKAGDTLQVHYTGWLTNGKQFDSSLDRAMPFSFKLGAGLVIKGWDEGLVGLRVGGKRKLTIPAALGYGGRGAGDTIPPNADLVFDVELLAIQ